MYIFPKQDKIVNAVFDGMKIAKENFTYWTKQDLLLQESTENFFTIHICQEISKLNNAPEIFIDAKMSDVLKCSLNTKDSYKEFMSKNDIKNVAYSITLDERIKHTKNNKAVSKAIIDINSNFTKLNNYHIETLNTMCKVLQRDNKDDSSLEFAIFAFYLDVSFKARKKIQVRLDEIIGYFDSFISTKDNLSSYLKLSEIKQVKNEGEWCIGCYVIEPIINKIKLNNKSIGV